ncbi:MAG TPA: sulfatase-like hydrolase/transferase [Candidatus Acidoferrales bacterium]|nr:sulfatase-like hydrolase/transferase [Candidatus Acidoferrales bacterium]
MFSRRDFLSGASAAAFAGAGAQASAAAARPPNFVLFLADDLGCHDIGAWGATDLKTPHIDAMAASGARFTNWYAAAPVCAPSRAALLTGRYPIRAGVPDNGPPLGPSERSIASLLKPAGYATGIFGKWHLGSTPETVPNAHGFDRFLGFHSGCIDYYSHRYYWGEPRQVNYHDLWRDRTEVFEDGQYATELFAREAAQFVHDNRANPFFLYVPFNGVHYPMHAPRKYADRFPNLEPERRMYAAMLSAVDDGVGQVMRTLRELRLLDNTLVFFSADNGATREARAGLGGMPATAGNNAPFRGNKFSAFDGGMHVPMVMSWPGAIPKGQVLHQMGNHVDLLPTICKAAGAAVPSDRTMDGFDALPLAVSGAKSNHDAIFWSSGGQLAVRRGNWKLVKNGKLFDGTPGGSQPLAGDDALFLSNLDEDPGESKNLRHRNPAMVDELATMAEKWLEDVTKP